MVIGGWAAAVVFGGAAFMVGVVMWLGVTGRIGNGKGPMNAPEVDPQPRWWEN